MLPDAGQVESSTRERDRHEGSVIHLERTGAIRVRVRVRGRVSVRVRV